MDINFFVLLSSNKRGAVRIEPMQSYNDYEFAVGIAQPTDIPMNSNVSEGKRFYDIVRFQDVCNWAISERFHKLLLDNQLTGWQSYEIKITGVQERYFGFQCLGKCGPLLNEDKKKGMIKAEFDIASWDGSDFFVPYGSAFFLCTEKVKVLLEKNKISNLIIMDFSKLEVFSRIL